MSSANNDRDAGKEHTQPAQPGRTQRPDISPALSEASERAANPQVEQTARARTRIPSLISTLSPEMQGQVQRALTSLQTTAKDQGETLQKLFPPYGGERLLARLGAAGHSDKFALKGGHLLRFLLPQGVRRATRDLDLMGVEPMPESRVRAIFTDAAQQPSRGDGIIFDTATMQVTPIREKAGDGFRVMLNGRLGAVRVHTQTDIGFNDVVAPDPQRLAMPSLHRQLPDIEMRAYAPSSIIAEKYEGMVKRGMYNSRMKDFYDVAQLSHHLDFRGEDVSASLTAAFSGKTLIPDRPLALTPAYYDHPDRQAIWGAFVKDQTRAQGTTLGEFSAQVWSFLAEPVAAAAAGQPFTKHWDHRSRVWGEG